MDKRFLLLYEMIFFLQSRHADLPEKQSKRIKDSYAVGSFLFELFRTEFEKEGFYEADKTNSIDEEFVKLLAEAKERAEASYDSYIKFQELTRKEGLYTS